ncbi:ribonuclease inhibitor [Microtetraspora sp. NBRC 16547]|uniref:ribonuclease inhibitor n=1 Tax=Microtetraspora sp. NBRC 16547 TaxID=3030993 RepID=UPI002553D2CD|nr:ribonuclease inhibitor [Microtetraspora sp. NBRC 16547]
MTPGDLYSLLAWLRTGRPVERRTDFAVGTAMPDGRLDLCKQALGPMGARLVAEALPSAGPTRHLLLGTDELGDAGAGTAADAATASSASTLYLGCNGIGGAGACLIADRLVASPGVVRGLWLKRNPVGPDGGLIIGEVVGTGLTTIDLVQTRLDAGGLAALVDHIVAAGGIGRLFVSGNPLGPSGAEELARLIAADGVEELYASAAGLGDRGAEFLTGALRGGRLRRLSLASNGIGPVAAAALIAAAVAAGAEMVDLGRVRAAGVLGAQDNHVGDDGAAAVAQALAASTHRPAHLNLRHTGIGSRGALHLLAGARNAAVPTRFVLGGGIASRVKRELGALAEAVPELRPHPEVAAVRSVHRTSRREESGR